MANAAPGGGDGLFVQCKSEVLRTYRSRNLGGAARPLEDHLLGRLALEGRLEGLVDKRRRLTLRNLPRQSWNKFRVPAFPLALLIEKFGDQFLTKTVRHTWRTSISEEEEDPRDFKKTDNKASEMQGNCRHR